MQNDTLGDDIIDEATALKNLRTAAQLAPRAFSSQFSARLIDNITNYSFSTVFGYSLYATTLLFPALMPEQVSLVRGGLGVLSAGIGGLIGATISSGVAYAVFWSSSPEFANDKRLKEIVTTIDTAVNTATPTHMTKELRQAYKEAASLIETSLPQKKEKTDQESLIKILSVSLFKFAASALVGGGIGYATLSPLKPYCINIFIPQYGQPAYPDTPSRDKDIILKFVAPPNKAEPEYRL